VRGEPVLDHATEVVEGGDLDIGVGVAQGCRAVDDLKVPKRREKGVAAAYLVVPAMARLKAKGGEEACQLVVSAGGGGSPDVGDALDHVFRVSRRSTRSCGEPVEAASGAGLELP
jgi:hypothetical protein